MENKLDLTVIVPLVAIDDKVKVLLDLAIKSIEKQSIGSDILFVCADAETSQYVEEQYIAVLSEVFINYKILVSDKTDFCSLVNEAVSTLGTKYFSILEYNSEYTPTYFKQIKEYTESDEYSGMDGFLPTTALVTDKGFMLQFANEAVWAQGFSETMGQLDFNTLINNNIFVLGGAVFSKEAFEEVGGFKKDIKLYFAYEFLLRYTNNDHNVVVLPKLGYKHMIDDKGTMFNAYRDASIGITPEEAKFYLDTAKKEYLFNPNEIERVIKYSPTEVA